MHGPAPLFAGIRRTCAPYPRHGSNTDAISQREILECKDMGFMFERFAQLESSVWLSAKLMRESCCIQNVHRRYS